MDGSTPVETAAGPGSRSPAPPLPLRTRPTALPAADDDCPWWDPTDADLIGRRLEDEHTFDLVIVGAGFSGLACARRLGALRPDWRIALVEALRIGQAASGRNSGYVVDTGHYRPKHGLESNLAHNRLSRHGIELLDRAVDEHAIRCDWTSAPRFHVCVNARGEAALKKFRSGLDAMREPYEKVDSRFLAEQLGTQHYAWGLSLPGGRFVQPTHLLRGLARALPSNVTLFEDSPIESIEPTRPRRLQGQRGSIRTDRLVLATNGWSSAWGISKNRLLPFVTYASITAPLGRRPGALEHWGVVPEELMGSTVRLLRDGRVLLRWGVHLPSPLRSARSVRAHMAEVHRRSFERRFPAFAHVPFTHTWGGVLGVTNNGGTRFGELAEDTWICAGHNGVGMAVGTGLGDLLACRIAGERHPRQADTRHLPAPSWLPPQPFLGIGIPLYTAWLAWLAGDEK